MPNYVTIDDKITRVMLDYTICETVESVTREGFTTKSTPGITSLRHSGEGITWVRGWLLPDSEDVKAARVAQALDENKEQVLVPDPTELMRNVMERLGLSLPPAPPPPPEAPWYQPYPTQIGIAPPSPTTAPPTQIGDPALTGFPYGKTNC
jgi:hypothetical protein